MNAVSIARSAFLSTTIYYEVVDRGSGRAEGASPKVKREENFSQVTPPLSLRLFFTPLWRFGVVPEGRPRSALPARVTHYCESVGNT
jgi:hypothetical protein